MVVTGRAWLQVLMVARGLAKGAAFRAIALTGAITSATRAPVAVCIPHNSHPHKSHPSKSHPICLTKPFLFLPPLCLACLLEKAISLRAIGLSIVG